MTELVAATVEPVSRPWPFTQAEQDEAIRKLAARPELLDRFLLELTAIARDADREARS